MPQKSNASIILALCFSLMLTACSSSVDLLTDISEAEVNEVIAALSEAGIPANKKPGKEGLASITIDQSQIGKAIATLSAEGLPRERFAKMGDVFRREGLISSPLEERARYLWALSQELSATISQIDGVLRARVHVVLPERSSGSDPALPSSASVFIKYRKLTNIDESSAQIKRLVSNSIPGLAVDKVTVILFPAVPIQGKYDIGQSASISKVWGYSVATHNADALRITLIGLLFFSLLALATSIALAFRIWGKDLKIKSLNLLRRQSSNMTE